MYSWRSNNPSTKSSVPGGPATVSSVAPAKPAGLEQDVEVGDVVEVVVGQEDGVDALVARLTPCERVEDAATAVDEVQAVVTGLDEETRLEAVASWHCGTSAEKRDAHAGTDSWEGQSSWRQREPNAGFRAVERGQLADRGPWCQRPAGPAGSLGRPCGPRWRSSVYTTGYQKSAQDSKRVF